MNGNIVQCILSRVVESCGEVMRTVGSYMGESEHDVRPYIYLWAAGTVAAIRAMRLREPIELAALRVATATAGFVPLDARYIPRAAENAEWERYVNELPWHVDLIFRISSDVDPAWEQDPEQVPHLEWFRTEGIAGGLAMMVVEVVLLSVLQRDLLPRYCDELSRALLRVSGVASPRLLRQAANGVLFWMPGRTWHPTDN